MNELINIKNDEATTNSLIVAEMFGKSHKNVVRKIEQILEESESSKLSFHKSYYKADGNRKSYPMYLMNRDGFSFLVMGFTGKKANEWKWKFIEAFNQMESYINTRKADKLLQKYEMKFLCDNLEMPTHRDFIKANTIADKCVSNLHGHPKMVKKAEMNEKMLEDRQPILRDVVELMAVKDKYDLDISVSKSIYRKYEEEIV